MRLLSDAGINRREFLKKTALAGGVGMVNGAFAASGRSVSIIRAPGDPVAASAPVEWAVREVEQSLRARGVAVLFHQSIDQAAADDLCIAVSGAAAGRATALLETSGVSAPTAPESLTIAPGKAAGRPLLLACGADARGLVYALMEIADRVNYADDPFEALEVRAPIMERPAERVGDEEGGTDGEQAGEGEVAGAEGARELRLANTESDEGDELEDEAGAVENEVNGDEPLEGQIESERPAQPAKEHADPGNTAAVAALEDARQHAVGSHGDGQARVAHHERVEHSHAADDSAGHDGHVRGWDRR